MKINSFIPVFVGAFIFFLGFFIGTNLTNKDSIKILRTNKNVLTNPLLDCEIYETSQNTKVNLMKKNVLNLINTYQDDHKEVSVFFRDLNNGPSFGINENNKFAPASLLKVPLMIAYLKENEKNPEILNKKILYNGDHYLKENLPNIDTLTPGSSYTVDNLIYRMIAFSDNLAFESLLGNIDQNTVKTVHKELDLIYPDINTPDDYISVKSYAGLFRVLYNSTYLNREMSDKALKYLTQSDFHLGIQAGIPKNTMTALKFGIRDADGKGTIQIHDCGIIYDQKKPYLLCIMTKGGQSNKLIEMIKDISKEVYRSNLN